MKIKPVLLSACLLCSLTTLAETEPAAEPSPPPAPETPAVETAAAPAADTLAESANSNLVVSVNGVELTKAELDQQLNRAMMQQRVPPQFIEQARQQLIPRITEGFISRQLLLQEATRLKFTATDEDVDKVLEDIKTKIPQGMTLEEAFKQQGVDVATVRRDVSSDLTVNKLVDHQKENIPDPSQEDLARYFETAKGQFSTRESAAARHILIKTAPTDDEAARATKKAKLEGIRKTITDGGDFAEQAKANSDCPSSAKGGSLGTFGRGQMVPPFEKAVFSQKIDEVGPIIETQFGYHIVQVTERTEAEEKKLEDVREQVVDQMKSKQLQEKMESLIEDLRSKATIIQPE